jgi:hypothetical protein
LDIFAEAVFAHWLGADGNDNFVFLAASAECVVYRGFLLLSGHVGLTDVLDVLVYTKIYAMSPNLERMWRLSHFSASEFVVSSSARLWSVNSGEREES